MQYKRHRFHGPELFAASSRFAEAITIDYVSCCSSARRYISDHYWRIERSYWPPLLTFPYGCCATMAVPRWFSVRYTQCDILKLGVREVTMRIFITGATGFIGRALTLRLLGTGHQVTAWVRDENSARSLLGSDVELVPTNSSIGEQIPRADAVINLGGEPVIGGRWTASHKRAIIESRLNLTRAIATAIAGSSSPLAVLISASAVGYYGDRGDETVEDDEPAGNDFLATLCRDGKHRPLRPKSMGQGFLYLVLELFWVQRKAPWRGWCSRFGSALADLSVQAANMFPGFISMI